ncbi:MAG: type ISP restriction/modification enzyme [Planctomycetota bacterium]
MTETTDAPSSGNLSTRILEDYLAELKAIHGMGGGVAETSYYPALSTLFNAAGKALKPKVRCVMNLRNLGAGMPDGGLFTPDQFQRQADGAPKAGQLPARGAIEAKGTKPEVKTIAESQQVKEYLKTYGIVIVTNLREFLIVERGANGQPVERESFALADDEKDFWQRRAAHPRATAQQKGPQFIEFIKRACLHSAPLTKPKDVAWFLASYARDALFRVEQQKELPALQTVRTALEDALGMKFTDEKGEHFFRSTLVQTLFYGVFSAWVRWHKDNLSPKARFDWQKAEWSLHVPFVCTLYEEVAKPSRLGPLGLVETLDWSAGVLNRVDRGEFFKNFEDEHAVQYFYEPFLEAYDPELRKALGVWYTPPEIVKYQVARVDTVLREELDLPDGLADPNVVVLDPCCGTGAYLVEVLRSIAATLRDKGGDALVASDLKEAAMNRIFGFEIMPAPFVVSHLQLGLMLQAAGAPLSQNKGERVGVYLTNALTGWEPPKDGKKQIVQWAELQEERDAAEHVKRDKRILVVLGNPPYNAFAGVSPEEEEGLVEVYKGVYYQEKKKTNKQGKTSVTRTKRYKLNDPPSMGGWGIKKFNLDDLYVRFFRLAERRIAEMSGMGVVSFISNHSWISEPSFVLLRQHLLESFDKFWIEGLHGNRKISEYAPDGRTSETIFAISGFSTGIQQGVATSLWVKTGKKRKGPAVVRFRDDLDAAKAAERRKQLLDSLNAKNFNAAYKLADVRSENRHSLYPEEVAAHYTEWPKLTDLCAVAPFNGPVERRGNSLISIDRDLLEERMVAYFDPTVQDSEVARYHASLMMTGNRIVGPEARKKLLKEHSFSLTHVVQYPFKVFDVRWGYLANIRPLFSEPSPHLLKQRFPGNSFFITRDTADKSPEGPPFYFSSLVCDYDAISGHARHFPLLLKNGPRLNKQAETTLFAALGDKPEADEPVANLSRAARQFLEKLKLKNPDDPKVARLIWMHALAIGYSPAYLTENADGIRWDWPRLPLPANRKALEASATLGEQIAALLDTEAEVSGVTCGKIAAILKTIGSITKTGGGQIDTASGDLTVTAGWGRKGKEGVTMPGKGKLAERNYDEAEAKAIDAEAAERGMSAEDVRQLLGEKTFDVYLNGAAYWRNIPLKVWEYYIGGYQVIKKWLSYREDEILGRALKPDEAREVINMARRLAAIVLMQPALDENYQSVKAAAHAWPMQAN